VMLELMNRLLAPPIAGGIVTGERVRRLPNRSAPQPEAPDQRLVS